jgi:nucleotide-binding universal stress UspA family protein
LRSTGAPPIAKRQGYCGPTIDKDVERSKPCLSEFLSPWTDQRVQNAPSLWPHALRVPLVERSSWRAVNVAIGFLPSLAGEATLVQSVLDAGRVAAEEYLAGIKQAPELVDITTETRILFGPVGSAILAIAESSQADLIVLCSHGYTGMMRWALGSVAEKVARYALVPVLVLREAGPVPAGPHPDVTRPLRALVALDGSVLAKAALEPAASLIAALAARLPLLIVRPPDLLDKSKVTWDAATLSEIQG